MQKKTSQFPMRKIKMIWDFRGPHSEKTAQHHVIHLNEFAQNNNLEVIAIDVQNIHDNHTMAFMVVTEDLVPHLRQSLKPHRGQLYEH